MPANHIETRVLRSRRPLPGTVLSGALLLIGACGDSGNDGPAAVKVTDTADRHCSVPFDAIDPPTCDESPMPAVACSAGTRACFQLGTLDVAAQYKPAAICAACCGET